MKLLCFGYRGWALTIYDSLSNDEDLNVTIIRDKEKCKLQYIAAINPDFILFYGWSWMIPDEIVHAYTCLMLHPSALPLFRGGSPIQNQIINNVQDSMVSIFQITSEVDAGPIYKQEFLSLKGNISDIFDRMIAIGIRATREILVDGLTPVPQNHAESTYFKRRTPAQSEITQYELMNMPAHYLYNKIRMLQDPYPNAYILTADNKKLFITSAFFSDL